MTFIFMCFLHIVDDFYLQKGLLANLKQASWWTKQEQYKEMYKHDYIVALIIHSFSWAFMIMIPIAFAMRFELSLFYIIALFINGIIHGVVDDLKANKLKINLITDQTVHLLQLTLTYAIYRFIT